MNNIKNIADFKKCCNGIISRSYDCTDRLVLNGYFNLPQTPGGFRVFWNQLFGNESNLNETHLLRFSSHFTRRLKRFCTAKNIPLIYLNKEDGRKDEFIKPYLPKQADFKGLFCVFGGKAPGQLRKIFHNKNGSIHISIKNTWCRYYYFHIMDPEWGHIIIRFCPHPPFNTMIILNGHEYVERQAEKANIKFTKQENCFINFSNGTALSRLASTMSTYCAEGSLEKVCNRWVYTCCLCFALTSEEQRKTGFRYRYSYYQMEYSYNFLYKEGAVMEKHFDEMIDKTRSLLNIKKVKTILGVYQRIKHKGKYQNITVSVEKPKYDLTVFKIYFGIFSVKLYSKGERVLRAEVTVHNTRKTNCRRSLQYFSEIDRKLKGILNNFFGVLDWTTYSCINYDFLEKWPETISVGNNRIAGIQINKPRIRAVMKSVLEAAAISPGGFNSPVIAELVREKLRLTKEQYTQVQARYDLNKLKARNLIFTIKKKRKYQVTKDGAKIMSGVLVFRDKLLIPMLAKVAARKYQRVPEKYRLDHKYNCLFNEFSKILTHFKLTG